MRILSLDPGCKTFGIAAVELDATYCKVLKAQMFSRQITEMTGLIQKDLKVFVNALRKWCREFKIDAVVVERYMNRGRTGTTIECVSAMIGALSVALPVEDVCAIPASQWKNALNKEYDLEAMYEECEQPPHVLDASMIGIYGTKIYFDVQPYSTMNKSKILKEINRWKPKE